MDLTIIKKVHDSKSNGHLTYKRSLHKVNSSYILVLTDYLTRFRVMYALPDRTADKVTKSIKKFIALHDVPAIIIPDNAAEFVGRLLKNVCVTHNINKLK